MQLRRWTELVPCRSAMHNDCARPGKSSQTDCVVHFCQLNALLCTDCSLLLTLRQSDTYTEWNTGLGGLGDQLTQTGADISDDETSAASFTPSSVSGITLLPRHSFFHGPLSSSHVCVCVCTHSFSTSKTPIDNICDDEMAHSASC